MAWENKKIQPDLTQKTDSQGKLATEHGHSKSPEINGHEKKAIEKNLEKEETIK